MKTPICQYINFNLIKRSSQNQTKKTLIKGGQPWVYENSESHIWYEKKQVKIYQTFINVG